MVIAVGAAFVLGMIYLLLLRCCAGVIIFLSFLAILAALAGGGCWVFFIGRYKYDEADKNFEYMTIGSYILWGIGGAFLILLICMWSRIRVGIAIIKCTAQFIQNTWSVFLIPIIFVILAAAWILAWLLAAVFLFSVGDIVQREAPL